MPSLAACILSPLGEWALLQGMGDVGGGETVTFKSYPAKREDANLLVNTSFLGSELDCFRVRTAPHPHMRAVSFIIDESTVEGWSPMRTPVTTQEMPYIASFENLDKRVSRHLEVRNIFRVLPKVEAAEFLKLTEAEVRRIPELVVTGGR